MDSTSGYGVLGEGYYGVYGTGDLYGVYGSSSDGFGVYGDGYYGVYGHGNPTGVAGVGDRFGVVGTGDTYGVWGYVYGGDDTAVYGRNWNTSGGNGVWGEGYDAVYGEGIRSGLFGRGDQYGVLGYGSTAGGYFEDTSFGTYTYVAYDIFGIGLFGIYSNGWIYGANIGSTQQHPTDASKSIIYAALEGGESGTYYRGTAQLEKGTARVELPEHFSLVTEEEGLTVQVTPRGDCNGLYVAEVTTTYLVVKELQGGSSDARFDFFINGVRSGYQDFQVEVSMAELGLDGVEHPPEPPRPAEKPEPPEPPEGPGEPEEGGTNE